MVHLPCGRLAAACRWRWLRPWPRSDCGGWLQRNPVNRGLLELAAQLASSDSRGDSRGDLRGDLRGDARAD